ncbi:MAG: HD domain-containing protein [Burkholderiales bacterium]|nr:HD domain-containing protein [Burkholderiales bacterium]
MNEAAAVDADAEPSPAFLQAVADLGTKQTVTTSEAIFNAQGVKLLEGGAKVDRGLYDRLISHRLSRPLDECVHAEPTVDGKLLREAAEAAMERWPFFAQLAPTALARESLLRLIASVPLPRPVALHLDLARNSRPGLFTHSVLMALLCAHLAGQGESSTRDDVVDAAAAGLLHDMGMLHIDPALLDADERLSGNRLNPVYVHPVTSSMLIDRFADYPKPVARAVIEHHERLDGSGYPRGLLGEAISPLGRIVSLAEVVTAMFDGEREQPEQRVSLLLRINPRRYDPALAAAVHRLLAALPPSEADAGDTPEHSIARLLRLADELERWRKTSESIGPALDGAHAALLVSMNEQHGTLQRMLYDAGVTHEQLGALGDDVEADTAMRIELWALAEELLWQLHSAANQLKRRWQATEPALAHPPALAAWFASVASLDDSPAAAG